MFNLGIDRYFWLTDSGGTWIPESGNAYYFYKAAEVAAQSYFQNIGYSGVEFQGISNWTLLSSFTLGDKYSMPIITLNDTGYVGYVLRYDVRAEMTINPSSYMVAITTGDVEEPARDTKKRIEDYEAAP